MSAREMILLLQIAVFVLAILLRFCLPKKNREKPTDEGDEGKTREGHRAMIGLQAPPSDDEGVPPP